MTEEEIIKQEKKINKQFWIKLIVSFVLMFSWGAFLFTRADADYSIAIPISLGILTILYIGFLFFSQKIIELLNKINQEDEEKIPREISEEEKQEIIEIIVERNSNHLVPDSAKPRETHHINKNVIEVLKVDLMIPQRWDGILRYPPTSAIIILNKNYPNRYDFLDPKTGDSKITSRVNSLSVNPRDEPDTENIIEENPLLGINRRTQRRTYTKPEPKKDTGGQVT